MTILSRPVFKRLKTSFCLVEGVRGNTAVFQVTNAVLYHEEQFLPIVERD